MEPQQAWSIRAACRGHGPATFFLQSDEAAEVAEAKAVCQACDVRTDCLGHALAFRERHGVWGGLTPTERQRILAALASVAHDAREEGQGRRPAHGLRTARERPGGEVIPWVRTVLA
jgi:predicted Fe-S protein YdhL (DUF1289 family)